MEKVVTTGCPHDCGGKCVLRCYVNDGAITRIESDIGEEPQLRACARGRAYRQRVYHPDRLKYPLVRVGERGEGRFARITWEEALGRIAGEIARIKDSYGLEAILLKAGPGSLTHLHSTPEVPRRFFYMLGGCTEPRGAMSFQAAIDATRYTLGTAIAANDIEDVLNSRLVILWSWNSAEMVNGTNTTWYLAQARERGARVIAIDPRLTDTAVALADQWLPVIPGTDAALMIAMAYVIVRDSLYDKRFIDTYTLGFDRFRDYLLGKEDGVTKTPAWAEQICGIPAATIEGLARDYATIKPAALLPGLGMQRQACGEQTFRASITLAAMTGNIGIPGGSPAGHWSTFVRIGRIPTGDNPLPNTTPSSRWADAVLQGKAGGYDSDIKMLYVVGSNPLVQYPNVNKGVAAMKKVETVIVHEQFLTPTARYADILLPITTHFEREDISTIWSMGHYAIYMNQVIPPMYECKSDLEVFTELAKRLGVEGFNSKTDEEWLRSFVAESEIPDFAEFKRRGVWHFRREPYIAFRKQILDPEKNPFRTPSGKIEIFSQRLAVMNKPDLYPSIPKYIEPWEGRRDPLATCYPLQLLTPASKRTALSVYTNIPWLEEMEPHALWLNSGDAAARGIRAGDRVRVHNDRGSVIVPARVTERILPGVVSLAHGFPFLPDEKGNDLGGCANTLTRDEDTVWGEGATTHSCLVEVARA